MEAFKNPCSNLLDSLLLSIEELGSFASFLSEIYAVFEDPVPSGRKIKEEVDSNSEIAT